MNKRIRRHDVLRAGAAAGFDTGLAPFALARPNKRSIRPRQSIRLGVIGVGNRGTHLLRLALDAGVEIPALCDIREDHLQQAREIVNWMEGRWTAKQWNPQDKFAKQFEHPLWTDLAERAKGSGHGGADFFILYDFLEAVRDGGPSPVDVHEAAAWSSIISLSGKSISGLAVNNVGSRAACRPGPCRAEWHFGNTENGTS